MKTTLTFRLLAIATALTLPIAAGLTACGGGSTEKTDDKAQTPATDTHTSDTKAIELATSAAGFIAKAPTNYWYADTSEVTAPSQSFGIFSEQANLRILCVLFDDMIPVNDLKAFKGAPPFVSAEKPEDLDGGQRPFADTQMDWYVGKYKKREEPEHKFKGTDLMNRKIPPERKILIASFPAIVNGKSFLLVAQAYDHDQPFDPGSAFFILDQLTDKAKSRTEAQAEPTKEIKANDGEGTESTEGSDDAKPALSSKEDIQAFLDGAKVALDEELSLPDNIVEAAQKAQKENGKDKKWVGTHMIVGVDKDGSVRKMEFSTKVASSENTEINRALEKAVKAVGKFENPPVVAEPTFEFKVRLLGTKTFLTPGGSDDF